MVFTIKKKKKGHFTVLCLYDCDSNQSSMHLKHEFVHPAFFREDESGDMGEVGQDFFFFLVQGKVLVQFPVSSLIPVPLLPLTLIPIPSFSIIPVSIFVEIRTTVGPMAYFFFFPSAQGF